MRRTKLCLAAASVLPFLACTREIPVAPKAKAPIDGVVGAYAISSVNGHPLPMQIGLEGSTAVDALSGQMQLDSTATFRDIVTIRLRGPNGIQVYTDTVSGRYLHFESTLLLQPNNGGTPYFLDVTDARTLTSWDYSVVVYRR